MTEPQTRAGRRLVDDWKHQRFTNPTEDILAIEAEAASLDPTPPDRAALTENPTEKVAPRDCGCSHNRDSCPTPHDALDVRGELARYDELARKVVASYTPYMQAAMARVLSTLYPPPDALLRRIGGVPHNHRQEDNPDCGEQVVGDCLALRAALAPTPPDAPMGAAAMAEALAGMTRTAPTPPDALREALEDLTGVAAATLPLVSPSHPLRQAVANARAALEADHE